MARQSLSLWPKPPAELRRMLDEYGLRLIATYSGMGIT